MASVAKLKTFQWDRKVVLERNRRKKIIFCKLSFAGVEKVMAGKMQMVTIMNTWVRFFVITDKCQQHCLPKSHQL